MRSNKVTHPRCPHTPAPLRSPTGRHSLCMGYDLQQRDGQGSDRFARQRRQAAAAGAAGWRAWESAAPHPWALCDPAALVRGCKAAAACATAQDGRCERGGPLHLLKIGGCQINNCVRHKEAAGLQAPHADHMGQCAKCLCQARPGQLRVLQPALSSSTRNARREQTSWSRGLASACRTPPAAARSRERPGQVNRCILLLAPQQGQARGPRVDLLWTRLQPRRWRPGPPAPASSSCQRKSSEQAACSKPHPRPC